MKLNELFDSVRLGTRLSSDNFTFLEDLERRHVLDFELSKETLAKEVRIEIQELNFVLVGLCKLVQISFDRLAGHAPVGTKLHEYGL